MCMGKSARSERGKTHLACDARHDVPNEHPFQAFRVETAHWKETPSREAREKGNMDGWKRRRPD